MRMINIAREMNRMAPVSDGILVSLQWALGFRLALRKDHKAHPPTQPPLYCR